MKIGDYVTGIDRSYPRSIYEVIGHAVVSDVEFPNPALILKFYSYYGFCESSAPTLVRPQENFRLATKQEIWDSLTGNMQQAMDAIKASESKN